MKTNITESNKILNDKIESLAKFLSKRITEIRFFDVEKVETSIKVHFKNAMIDCLKLQVSKTNNELNKLKHSIGAYSGYERVKRQSRISELKVQLKSENKLYSLLDNDRQAKEMVLWMRKNHPNSILEFYKMYDEKYPNKNTGIQRTPRT